jgi:hypothetical protein
MWDKKMSVVWEEIMKFPPTENHIKLWTKRLLVTVPLGKHLEQLSVEDILKVITQAQAIKGKGDESVAKSKGIGSPILKSRWKELMGFPPTRLHLAILQEQLDIQLGIDAILAKTQYDDLIEIVGEIAVPPTPLKTDEK